MTHKETVSFHRVAIFVFMEQFKSKEFGSIFTSSSSFQRSIHIFAFALKDLIMEGLRKLLTLLKLHTIGQMKSGILEGGGDAVTVMLGMNSDVVK